MNSFTFLLVCAQAFFIQNAIGQCIPCGNAPVYPVPAPVCAAPELYNNAPPPYYNAPASYYNAPAPYYNAPGSYYNAPAPYYPAPGNLWGGAHGISVSGDNLVIDGIAQVSGAIPFVSSVQLDGDVPADGAASLRNACCCGDKYM